jgi:phospholipid/cholesterol/gamma-HCH transport system substrate-binding protein
MQVHDYKKNEIVAGAFLILGLALLGYLSISIGGLTLLSADSYHVRARFSNVGDLKGRAPVKVAGVTVGKVQAIRLANFYGEVDLAIDRKVVLPKDTIASIATAGLLGDAYVSLSPGGSEANLGDGDQISHTEPALNMADLVGKYAFGSAGQGTGDKVPAEDKGLDKPAPPAAPAPEPSL